MIISLDLKAYWPFRRNPDLGFYGPLQNSPHLSPNIENKGKRPKHRLQDFRYWMFATHNLNSFPQPGIYFRADTELRDSTTYTLPPQRKPLFQQL